MAASVDVITHLRHSLECPFGLSPLTTAVSLNCSHKVSEEWAKKVYGEMVDGQCTKENETCPECTQVVTSYSPDLFVRSLAERVFHSPLNGVLEKCSVLLEAEHKKAAEIPFPGGGKFVHCSGEWKPIVQGDLNRLVKFKSVSKESAFVEISFFGFKQGNISLTVTFNRKRKLRKQAIKYLASKHLTRGDLNPLAVRFCAKSHKEQVRLFSIITKNNELPGKWMPLLEQLVKTGKWM